MNLARYPYFTNDFQDYEFFSDGPKGKIKKVVRFTKVNDEEPVVYNLGFGDAVDEIGIIDDSIISNNTDRDLVLATVANTIIDFTNPILPIIMATIIFTQPGAPHHVQDCIKWESQVYGTKQLQILMYMA